MRPPYYHLDMLQIQHALDSAHNVVWLREHERLQGGGIRCRDVSTRHAVNGGIQIVKCLGCAPQERGESGERGRGRWVNNFEANDEAEFPPARLRCKAGGGVIGKRPWWITRVTMNAHSIIWAQISEPMPQIGQPASTVTSLLVFLTDAITVSMSSGRIERRLMISQLMPSSANLSAATSANFTPIEWAQSVTSVPCV